MSELRLQAQPRTITRRKVGQLRTQGLVPVVVYGKTQEPILLQVNARNLDLTLHHGGFSQLISLNVEGGATHNVLIREVQRHPINRSYIHADFYAVNMAEKQHVSVQVVGVGRPMAQVTGLIMLQMMDAVSMSALPADIPATIEVDVTTLDLEKPILVSDLPVIAGVEYLSDPSDVVFTLTATRVEVEEESVAAEEAAEPEVVIRGHQDDDE